ncbi:MAG: YecA family protein [Pseudonocardiaceae bacterium]
MRSQARGKRVRAAVALLAARAAEGAGDSVAASGLISEALTHRPDLEPALHDAAQYAAARGDYLAADGYLRRARLSDSLQPGLAEILTAAAVEVPRNSPCPCGSGRKFKTCCRHNATPPLAVRAQLVYALLGSYGEHAPGIEIIKPLLDRAGGDEWYSMFFLDLALFQKGLVDKFLAARGHWLRPDERALINDWRTIPVTLYESVDVQHGTGVTLRALPDGDPSYLSDKLFSLSAPRLELFCGRLLHDGTTPRMLALPVRVARHHRRALTDLLAAGPSAEQIADFFAPEPPVQLRNSDGDDLYDCRVTYHVPHPQRAFDRLTQQLTQAGNDLVARHRPLPDGRMLNLGEIHWVGDDFIVTANSPARLTELEDVLHSVAPDAVERDRRADRISPEPDDREARTLIMETYFVDAEEAGGEPKTIGRSAEATWLDTPDVIGDLTPREAATSPDPKVRTELHSMIDDIEAALLQAQRAGQPTFGLMDPHRVREQLRLL